MEGHINLKSLEVAPQGIFRSKSRLWFGVSDILESCTSHWYWHGLSFLRSCRRYWSPSKLDDLDVFFLNMYIYISNRYIKIYIYIHTHDTAIFGGSMKISPNHPKKAAVNDRPSLLSGQPVGSNLWGSTLKAIRGVVGGGGGPYASCCLSPLKLEPFKRGQWDPRKIPNLRGMLWNL